MHCPHCKLENPPDAGRCDCGYDFQLLRRERPYSERSVSDPATRSALVSLALAASTAALCALIVKALSHTNRFRNVDPFALLLQTAIVLVPLFFIAFAVQYRLRAMRHRLFAVLVLAAAYPLWLLLSLAR